MAAVITSVVPAPGAFTNAIVTINGTGFGASTGQLWVVFPDFGATFNWGTSGWSTTVITTTYPAVLDFQDQGITYPTNVYFVVVPLGDAIGGRSAAAQVTEDPTPILSFANNTLIVAGPTATAESGGGPITPPVTVPLRTALGRTTGFNNPSYDVKWIEYQNPGYDFGLDGFSQTDFSIVGPSVQTTLDNLGIFLPSI